MTKPNDPTPETRGSLILRLKNAEDRVAWQEFVEIYEPLIVALAMSRGLQRADADDVAQEVMSSVASHIEDWHAKPKKSSFRAWLATITRNQTFLMFRKKLRQASTGMDSTIGRQASELAESEFDLEQERQLFLWAARRIQDRFEASTWKAFWLTAVDERSISDVAKQLEMSVAQVYVARSRVMKALKLAVQNTAFDSQANWRVS